MQQPGQPQSAALRAAQNAFHNSLCRYVNNGGLFGPVLTPGSLFRASTVFASYSTLSYAEASGPVLTVEVLPYAGDNRNVQNLQIFLERRLREDLVGAYIHGSLGSYEEVPYSDFDALVVIKDAVMHNPKSLARVARTLCQAQVFMAEQDPLQHHGWFVLTEADLRCYCDAYFPSILFAKAKSLLGVGMTIGIRPRCSAQEVNDAFHALAGAVIKKLEERRYPKNAYTFKLLLSQFMLLPALYVQARDGRGVWKGDSFASAESDFSKAVWAPMRNVSALRQAWALQFPPWYKWLSKWPNLWSRYLRSRISLPIPAHLAEHANPETYEGMLHLSKAMRIKLEQRKVETERLLTSPAAL